MIEGHDDLPTVDLEDLGPLGEGGMGVVRRVRDPVLDRVLALKILRPELQEDPAARTRFLREARLMARLQHPGVVPITALGRLPDGRLGLVMQEVRGGTLTEIIAATHAGRGSLRRAVELFARACEAVAYAHQQGVVHRDLKPDNIMVGDFGEVLVLDWGLARVAGQAEVLPGAVSGGGGVTRWGEIVGTPQYMAPEQALGEAAGPASDVYALGATLHEILSGRPPFADGDLWEVLAAAQNGEVLPVTGALPVPPPLADLAGRAMALDPAARPPDARAFAAELGEWLDDSRRRAAALAVVAEADALLPEIDRLRDAAAERAAEAARLLAPLDQATPVKEKKPAWDAQDEAAEALAEAAAVEQKFVQLLHTALYNSPELPEAAARLSDHYRARQAEAEARGDPTAASWESLLRATDRGRHADWLAGRATLTVASDPPGADVALHRVVERGRRREAEPPRPLGPAPASIEVARGDWMLTLTAPGRAPARLSVHLPRLGRWDGSPDGVSGPVAIHLPVALAPDERLVSAGPFRAGGDDEAADGLPAATVWLDAFALRRDPVTVAEYATFLSDLRDPDTRAAATPRPLGADQHEQIRWEEDGDEVAPCSPLAPPVVIGRWPVTRVTWHAAVAFAAWEATRTGLPWRLPHELEWEKAGRGADGRAYPWGDFYEPTWARALAGQTGRPAVAAVDATPGDESPYGVRGLAGNVSEWCANPWRRAGPPLSGGRLVPDDGPADFRVIRGGSYRSSARLCRLASRAAGRPDEAFSTVGFRLARSLGPPVRAC